MEWLETLVFIGVDQAVAGRITWVHTDGVRNNPYSGKSDWHQWKPTPGEVIHLGGAFFIADVQVIWKKDQMGFIVLSGTCQAEDIDQEQFLYPFFRQVLTVNTEPS